MGSIVNLGRQFVYGFLKLFFILKNKQKRKAQKTHLVLVVFLKNIKNKKNTNFKEQEHISLNTKMMFYVF